MSRISSDFLRVVAMLGVLTIHAAGKSEWSFMLHKNYLSADFIGVILSQLSRFSVPVFLFLSAYGLSKSQQGQDFSGFNFFKSRFLRIGLPFLFWSSLFFVLGSNQINCIAFAKVLLSGSADYHFYFFPIIFQCYLFYALMRKKRKTWLMFLLLISLLVFTSPSHFIFQKLGFKRPDFHSAFFIYWIFYFYLGICFAEEKWALKIKRIPKALLWVLLILSVFTLLGEYLYFSNFMNKPGNFNHFNRYTVIFYSLAVILLVMAYNDKIVKIFQKREMPSRFLKKISALSFFIYITHTQFLRFIEDVLKLKWFFPKILFLAVSSFTLAFLVNMLFKRVNFFKKVLGI